MMSGPVPVLRRHLYSSTALGLAFAVLGSSAAADSLPNGSQTVSGSVVIGTSGSTMTVTQGSEKAIVSWNGFSVGQGNSVNFVQPGKSSAILNRVTGNATSAIAGSITGNGQVYLINPNGIAITPTGSVKVGGGFVASTLDVSNEDFLKGQYRFNGNGASASVSNEGVITVGRGGYAALIGGTVKNGGLIAVPIGKVGLGSGEQATLDLSGDGFLQVAVPTKHGAEGKGALIENSGTVSTKGGAVVMSAATARNAARHAINLSGVVEADSVSGSNGSIVIGGGNGGKVSVSGKVSAKSTSAKGGTITVTGQSVALKGATVDASGTQGGGTVKIGGDHQGKGTTQRAETISIDAASTVRADATQSGNGGSIVVWSDNLTSFAGLITALGAGTGSNTGKGGDAEVSGKALLDYAGFANLSGPGGFGTLLLDPYNVTISNGTASNVSGLSPTGNDSVINVTTLQNALAGANVTVTTGTSDWPGSQAGNITVANAVTWASGSTLTLSAYDGIAVNANLTGGTGSSIVLRSDNSATGIGTVTFGTGVTASASGGVSLYYNPTGNDNTSVNGTSYTTPTNYSANAGSSTTLNANMLVNTIYDLQNIRNNLAGTYGLGRDIDGLAETVSWNDKTGFQPIGSASNPFSGSFDGMEHSIKVFISRHQDDNFGLFGVSAGSLANVSVSGVVDGNNAVGALVGLNTGHVFRADAFLLGGGASSVGGLVGINKGTVENSTSTGSTYQGIRLGLSSLTNAGGLVGTNEGLIKGSSSIFRNISGKVSGGLVGTNSGTIVDSTASSNVSGTTAGGLVGINSGTISRSSATDVSQGAVISGCCDIGGLVGFNSGVIKDSFASLGISLNGNGDVRAGGLVGFNSGELTNVYASGPITSHQSLPGDLGNDPIPVVMIPIFGGQDHGSYPQSQTLFGTNKLGGLVGQNDGAIFNAYASGDVTGEVTGVQGNVYQFVGGLVGQNRGTLNSVHASGNVTANTMGEDYGSKVYGTGGLVGWNVSSETATATIIDSYASGKVYGHYGVGGFVGVNSDGATISRSFSTGDVTGARQIGGLIGLNQNGTINQTYSTGAVSSFLVGGTQLIGGLIGSNQGTVSKSFWNTTSSGQTNGVSATDGSASVGITGLTTAEMQNPFTFINDGWNFSTDWGKSITGANGGYMMLRPLSTGLYDDYVTVSGNTTTTYGDTKPSLASLTLDGVGINYITLDWASKINQRTNVGTYSYSSGDIITVTDQPGRTVYADYGEYTLTITPRPIAVTADNRTMVYGNAVPTLTYTVGGAGLVNGDSLSGALSTGATSSSNVGNYAISRGTLANSNYAISYVSGDVTVTPRAITVAAANKAMTYGNSVPTLTYTIGGAGLVNGDSLSGALASTATSSSNVGSYSISQGTLGNSNYAINYTGGMLTVAPRAIAVSANNLSMTYGDAVPSLTYSVSGSGLVNGDALSGALETSANASSNTGSYAITQGTLAASSNYAMTYVGGTATVTPRPISVSANNQSIVYGDALPTLTYSVGGSGLVNGDTLSGVLDTSAAALSSIGDYAVTQGTLAASSNYAMTYVGGTVTVAPRPITVNANSQSMLYGDAVPTLTYTVGGRGLVQGDVLSGALATPATSFSDVNAYAITRGSLAASANYTLTYVGNTMTITPATLSVTAGSGTMIYGDGLPLLGHSISGWKNGQNDALFSGVSVSSSVTSASNVGTYTTTASGGSLSGAASGNYKLAYVDGTMTVTPATLTVTAGNRSMVYGDGRPSLSYGVSGWKNGQTADLLSDVTVRTSAGSTSSVGTYSINAAGGTLSGAASGNYSLIYVDGSLSVAPRPITVTANAATMVYGDAAPSLTYRVSEGALVNGDRLSGALTSLGTSASPAGTYAIEQGSLGNGNYALTYVGNRLAVAPATLTVTPGNGSMIWHTHIPSLGYSVSGWKNGQDDSLLSGISVSTDATLASEPGSYKTSAWGGILSGAASGNYDIAYANGAFRVVPVVQISNPITRLPLPFDRGPAQVTTISTVNAQAGIPGTVTSNGWNPSVDLILTQHPNLSGAVCSMGPNFAIAC